MAACLPLRRSVCVLDSCFGAAAGHTIVPRRTTYVCYSRSSVSWLLSNKQGRHHYRHHVTRRRKVLGSQSARCCPVTTTRARMLSLVVCLFDVWTSFSSDFCFSLPLSLHLLSSLLSATVGFVCSQLFTLFVPVRYYSSPA